MTTTESSRADLVTIKISEQDYTLLNELLDRVAQLPKLPTKDDMRRFNTRKRDATTLRNKCVPTRTATGIQSFTFNLTDLSKATPADDSPRAKLLAALRNIRAAAPHHLLNGALIGVMLAGACAALAGGVLLWRLGTLIMVGEGDALLPNVLAAWVLGGSGGLALTLTLQHFIAEGFHKRPKPRWTWTPTEVGKFLGPMPTPPIPTPTSDVAKAA